MSNNLLIKLKHALVVAVIPVTIYLVFLLLQPERFGSLDSIFLLVQQAFVPTIASIGLYFIITMGLFDFSIGAILVMSSLVGLVLVQDYGYPGFILGCIVTAVMLQAVNALLYTFLRIPSLIVTVGTMMIFEAVGSFIAPTDLWIPAEYGHFGRFPANIILGIAVVILAYFIMNRTRIGVYMQAIGQSETIAKNMGVDPVKIKFFGFLLCGFFVGLGAMALCSFNGGMVAQIDMSSMMRVFTPVIGCFIGITLKKICNVMIGIFIGQFIVSMITLGLMTLKVDVSIQNFITGAFLIFLVAISASKKKDVIVK